MSCLLKIIIWTMFLFEIHSSHSQYTNDTVNLAKVISDDFRSFQKTGKRVSGRDSRRLISFDTRNDNIEIGLEFSVPFLTIPVKRSLNTMKTFASSTTSYVTDPIANINTGAVALTGTVVIAGVATAYLWKTFIRDQLIFLNRQNPFAYGRRNGFLNELDGDDPISKFTETIEKVLQKYDIDATACTQRTLCSSVRDAAHNVAKGKGTSTEKILDGITSASWIKRFTAGTAINDAINAGHHSSDCEQKYSGCKLKLRSFEDILETVLISLS